jgi:hypothetical protein
MTLAGAETYIPVTVTRVGSAKVSAIIFSMVPGINGRQAGRGERCKVYKERT